MALVNLAGTERLKRVVILNPKGGSGKTTLAFGVAGYLACTGRTVALPAAAVIGGLAIGTWYFAAIYKTPVGATSRLTDPPIPLSSAPIHPIVPNRQTSTSTPRENRPEAKVHQATEPTATQVDDPGSRWRLAGVVQSGGARVLVLNDRSSDTTVNLSIDSEFDGWSVADSGRDYAVLRQGSREIRLGLNEETTN